MDYLVVGICGGTGSGKSTLAERIRDTFSDECVYIQMDSYYKNNAHMEYEERCKVNYDHPDAFDTDLFINQIQELKAGHAVDIPQYDFTVHLRKVEKKHIEPKRIIILEGILLFESTKLTSLMDMKIFVDTDADVRILRRAIRDVNERGRTLDSVRKQYLTTVKPMHEKYIEPSKKLADIIVPEGAFNQVAFEMIVSAIKSKISD